MTMKREEQNKKMEEEGSPSKRMNRKIPLEVKSKVTKRGLFKIFEKVRIKLIQEMRQNIGIEFDEDIENALQDP